MERVGNPVNQNGILARTTDDDDFTYYWMGACMNRQAPHILVVGFL